MTTSPSPRWTVERHEAVESTMLLARARVAEGAPDRTVIRAASQTGGHGRHGRSWASPPGNLYMTLILRPELPAARAGEVSLVAAVALADAFAALTSEDRNRLKWPNDVLLDGGKVAGILPEAIGRETTDTGEARLSALILGLGVNVMHKPDLPDRKTSRLIDALPEDANSETNARLEQIQTVILNNLEARLDSWLQRSDGFARVRADWVARGPELGSPISVKLGDGTIQGAYKGLGEDGSLLLRGDKDGEDHRILAGEVIA
jgi:BirA family biotin operon repressor/biotin-[acetyl-CoA-carboxylase] ligase